MQSPSQWPPSAPVAPAGLEDEPVGSGSPRSSLLRFGTAVGVGAAAAMVAAIPAALRVAEAPEQTAAQAWAALAALALVPMVVAVLIVRGARSGLRMFAGPGAGLRAYGMALWAAMTFVVLTYFGSILRATTHHHGLAGATFAIGGAIIAGGLALLCARIVGMLKDGSNAPALIRGAFGGALPVAVLAAVGLVCARLMAGVHDAESMAAAGAVVDAIVFTVASILVSRPSLESQRVLAIVGPPVAVLLVVVGMVALRDPLLRSAIDARAPAFSDVMNVVPGL